MAGATGLECATCGFGDRRSTCRATLLCSMRMPDTSAARRLLRLPVRGVGAAPAAELAQLQSVRIVLLVLLGRVVALLAGGTLQGHDHHATLTRSHCCASTKIKPSGG